MGHTPGPWMIRPLCGHENEIMAGQIFVAATFSTNPDSTDNARLIAAAPDLLRIGQSLLTYSRHGEPDIYVLNGLLAELEEVLANASGSQS